MTRIKLTIVNILHSIDQYITSAICAINKKTMNVGLNASGMSYPKQTTLTKQPIKKGIFLLSTLDTVVKFYPKVFS